MRQFQGVNGRRRQTDARSPIGRLFFIFFIGARKSEAFRLPLAKKMSTPSTTLSRQIDGA
jgi:hypothetical protein